MKDFRLRFDLKGLLLFAAIIIPNIIWAFLPAPNDILRGESITPMVDMIASFFQIIMVAAICLFGNDTMEEKMPVIWRNGIFGAYLIYLVAWLTYYTGVTNAAVILLLCIAPCLAFLFFAVARNNRIAMFATGIFMVCHVYYGVINYII